ncbi:TRAFAC clade GTPase domain-containing protein [Geodermatophilus sp. URMC 64]
MTSSSLYNDLRVARDEHGVALDATDGVLLMIARARTGDPEELSRLLRNKGIKLAPATVGALAAVVRSSRAGTGPAAPEVPGPRPDGDAQLFPQDADRGGQEQQHRPVPPPPQSYVVGNGSAATAASAGPHLKSRRKNRRGLSATREERITVPKDGETAGYEPGPGTNAAEQDPIAPPTEQPVPPGAEAPEGLEAQPTQSGATEASLSDWSDDLDVFAGRENQIGFTPLPGDQVELRWPALDRGSQQLAFLVVSSPTSIPVRPSAGTRILVTEEPRALVLGGTGPYFSVFSYAADDRASLLSACPEHHAAGRMVPEVTNLRVNAHPDAVMLSWTAPEGVDRVRVVRSRPDQSLLPGFHADLEIDAEPRFARDTGVLPGHQYAYRVVTQFVDSTNGRTTLSTGVEASAFIPATPEPVTELTAQVTGDATMARVELRWPTPALGTVVVYQADAVPEHAAAGRVISTAQLAALSLGEQLGEPVISDGSTSVVPNIPFSHTSGPRRAFTPVTIIGDQAAVGEVAVVNLLGAVTDVEITERVDWQLLRFAWPVGASTVQVARGAIGGAPDGAQPISITQEEYERQGGMRLNLHMGGCDLHIRGAVFYAGTFTHGPVTTTTYPGRWVLRYRLEKTGFMGRRRNLQVMVDRRWPDFHVGLVTNPERIPLTPYDGPQAPQSFAVQGAAVVPNEWFTVDELPGEPGEFARLFAAHPSFPFSRPEASPIVIDPPIAPRRMDPPPPPLGQGQVRCLRCMTVQPEAPQVFRCVGRCSPQFDERLSAFLGEAVQARPLFVSGNVPFDTVACPHCNTPTSELVCKECHAGLPAAGVATDPVTVSVIGARGTGKTTYLVRLFDWLQHVWGPATGAAAAPLDAHTDGRIRQMRESFDQGRTVGSTVRAEQNADVLSPLVLRLDQRNGRLRTLAFYDVAGEDVENPAAVRPYGPTMARADALLFLLDPLQIRGVRTWLDGQIPLPPVAGDPLLVMENVINEIRRRRGSTARIDIPVMVAVSKLDGMHRAVATPGTELSGRLNGGSALRYDRTPAHALELFPEDQRQTHEETRSLLLSLNATQFVHQVESAFSRVEYFGLSALGHAPAGGTTLSEAGLSSFRVADPLRWLVARRWPTGR